MTDTIHHQLAGARAQLAAAKDAERFAKALAEAEAAAALNGALGKNAEERERTLTLALLRDPQYQAALAALRSSERLVLECEADLEAWRDARRESEWAVRAALVNALERRAIFSDAAGADASFDDVADEAAYQAADGMSRGDLNSTHYAGKPRPRPTYAMLADDESPF